MNQNWRTMRIAMPPLSDQAAVDIRDFLQQLTVCFESRYGDQIHRYYEQRSEHNLRRPVPPPTTDGDPF